MPGLSARQRQYLSAMGIDVWEKRVENDRVTFDHAATFVDHRLVTERGASDTAADWQSLPERVRRCTQCELHKTRRQTVFGSGSENADWMFVGEAPGAEEDRQGLPFVGRAGQLLNAMLTALGMEREQVYIANVLKCRPPNNRDPMGEEVRQCEPYLHQQVAHIGPRIIIALGRFAAQSLLKTTRPIGKLRSEVFSYGDTGIPLIVTYHPAYLLRNPLDKRKAWQDLCLARKIMMSL